MSQMDIHYDEYLRVLLVIHSTTNGYMLITKDENSLMHLKNANKCKTPTMDVMKIVHRDIHPTLLSYNLQLRR
jgi:hypothetical protein